MLTRICDLCGKPLDSGSGRRFKVKEYNGIWKRWERIDVHKKCLWDVLDALKEKEDGRHTD